MSNQKGKYGFLSAIFSVVGLLMFYINSIGENGVLNIYFFIGIASWITSIALGINGVKSKENGFLKYIGIIIILSIIVGYALLIIIVGLRGFGA